jgi:hypothetical protein
MHNISAAIDAPRSAGMVPALLVIPYLSVLALAVFLNWGR